MTRFVTVSATVVAQSSLLYLYHIATVGSNVTRSQMQTSANQIVILQRNDTCSVHSPFSEQPTDYRVIQNDCRGVNNLSYTIHLR